MRKIRLGIFLAIAFLVGLAGCENVPDKTLAPEQKSEPVRRAPVPQAARQAMAPTSEPSIPTADAPSVQELQKKLDEALRQKGDAERDLATLRKLLEEERAAHAADKKALQEARTRLAALQASRPPAPKQAPRDEDTFKKLVDLAREFYEQNEFLTTRRILQCLAEMGYEDGQMFFMLGRSCQETDDLKGALSNYGKCTEVFEKVSPKPATYLRALLNMGVILRLQGRYADAEAAYRRAIQADPNYASAYYNLGVLYEEFLKDKPKALAAYEKYVDLRGEKQQEAQERIKRLKPAGDTDK